MIRRRDALIALALAALAIPCVSRAQAPGGIARIGYIALPSSTPNVRLAAFRQSLRDPGYVEGRNLVIEYRSAEGKYERFPALAEELVRLKVDVILADDGTPSALAARNATRTIPIVFPALNDPVGAGIIASLARPGANVTGLTLQSPATTAKRLQLLTEMVPSAKRVVVLTNPGNLSHVTWLKDLPGAARKLAVELSVVQARGPDEIDAAFADVGRKGAHGLIIFDDTVFFAESSRIAALAARMKLPTIGGNSVLVEAGALASYGPNRLDLVRRTAALVGKILKGAKPADLPVEQASKFDLVVNAKTAKALGIAIPQPILARADRVIE